MTKWPQQFWLTKPMAVMVMLIFASSFVAGCGPTPPEPTSTPASFSYLVRVQAESTSEPISEAKVKIEVGGKATLDEITDSDGYARIFIDSSHTGQPGKLIVEATDYERYEKHIDLIEGSLPKVVQLQKKSVPVLPCPTPTMPSSDAITPITLTAKSDPTPKSTPMPTSTSITSATPTQPYPALILVKPVPGAAIVGEELTNFSWRWDGVLQEREQFDLRIWRSDKKTPSTVAILRERSYLLDSPPDGFGQYQWQVAVVRVDESGGRLTLSESRERSFVWSPDAVVNVKTLNLRFGPGTVYKILGVLKRGDCLKVIGRNLVGDWLKIICPGGQEGWTARSLLQVNVDMADVPVAQAPPTPVPTVTPTAESTEEPTLEPTEELTPLPTPELLYPPPEDAAPRFFETVQLKWKWFRRLDKDEYFSVRIRPERARSEDPIPTPCWHSPMQELQCNANIAGYCTSGGHYWSVAVVKLDAPDKWEPVSGASEERWFDFFESCDESRPGKPIKP